MGAYFVKCTGFKKDEDGTITEVICTYDPETKSGSGFNARKVKGTIHWVDAQENVPVELHMLYPLLKEGGNSSNFMDNINPDSLVVKNGFAEISVKGTQPGDRFQFVRNGYFCADTKYSTPDHLVFNRTADMKSGWRPEK